MFTMRRLPELQLNCCTHTWHTSGWVAVLETRASHLWLQNHLNPFPLPKPKPGLVPYLIIAPTCMVSAHAAQ